MWQHEIISDITQLKYSNNSDGCFLNNVIKIVATGLPKCHAFYLGTVDIADKLITQYEKTKESMEKFYDYENTHFPYDFTLWEFDLPTNNKHGDSRGAYFVIDCKDKVLIQGMAYTNKNKWVPAHFYVLLNKVSTGPLTICTLPTATDEEKIAIGDSAQNLVSNVLCFCKILSCKNIEAKEITPQISRQMRRHGNVKELYSYHVLTIKPIGKNSQNNNSNSCPEEHNRIHFCRGHFKQFSPNKPLFGRYTGLYWWEPHLRGNDKSGFVDKDYNVHAPTGHEGE